MLPANFRKAILLGTVMWILLFVAAGVVMNSLGSGMIGIVLIFIGPIISIPIAYLYLKTTPNQDMFREGFKLGIIWAIWAFVLDLLIMVLIFGRGFAYYTSWTLWLGYCEMIGFSTLVGYLMIEKNNNVVRARNG